MGLRVLNHKAATYWEPEQYWDAVYSDISGEEIDDLDNIWEVDEYICSEEEMIESFREYVVDTYEYGDDPDLYNYAKRKLIEQIGLKEEDFADYPTILVLIDDFRDNPCEFIRARDLYTDILHKYLPEDFHRIDYEDLQPEDGKNPDDPYDRVRDECDD